MVGRKVGAKGMALSCLFSWIEAGGTPDKVDAVLPTPADLVGELDAGGDGLLSPDDFVESFLITLHITSQNS